jgi:hypothetical protein
MAERIVKIYPSDQFPSVDTLPLGELIALLRRVQASQSATEGLSMQVAGVNRLDITYTFAPTFEEGVTEAIQFLKNKEVSGLTPEETSALLDDLRRARKLI